MNAQLSTLDLVIVGLYVLSMTWLGLRFSGQQSNLKTYFVGDRNVGWFMVLVSIVATETSAVTFLSVPGLAYNPAGGNLGFLQLALGYILGRILVAAILLPPYMKGELFSAYQVLRERFGPAVQRAASGIFIVTRTIADGLRLYLTALVMQYVGWGIEAAIVAVGVVTIFYTFLGGMKAVLWTDLIQFIIKIGGAALALVTIIQLLPNGWDTFLTIGRQADKFSWLNPEFQPTVVYNIWAGVLGGAVFSMASHGADQLMVQRYLCARNLSQARWAVVLSGVTVFFMFLLFLLVGVGLFAARQSGVFETGTATKDEVFGLFIVTQMPTGIVGILVAAILAAAMSTLSSSLNSSANAIVTDFYRPLRPHTAERQVVRLSQALTIVFGLLQIGVGLVAHWSGSERSVVDRVLAVAGLTTGLILGLFLLGMLPRRVGSPAALVGLLVGFVTVVAVWMPSTWDKAILAWPWYAPLGALVTLGVAWLTELFLSRRHGSLTNTAN